MPPPVEQYVIIGPGGALIGPFADSPTATAYARREYPYSPWQLVPLRKPASVVLRAIRAVGDDPATRTSTAKTGRRAPARA